jgi:hypothetical protein
MLPTCLESPSDMTLTESHALEIVKVADNALLGTTTVYLIASIAGSSR